MTITSNIERLNQFLATFQTRLMTELEDIDNGLAICHVVIPYFLNHKFVLSRINDYMQSNFTDSAIIRPRVAFSTYNPETARLTLILRQER